MSDAERLARDARDVIAAIEAGTVAVKIMNIDEPLVIYKAYDGSRMWLFDVFEDCGDWDYIDVIEAHTPATHERLEWPEHGSPPDVLLHRPPRDALYDRWHWNDDGESPCGYTLPTS